MKLFLVECTIESCYVWAGFQLNFLAKKAPGGRSWWWDGQKLFTSKSIKAGQQIILIKYRRREEKRPSTIDFKAFVYTFFLTVIFINKDELTEWEKGLFAD